MVREHFYKALQSSTGALLTGASVRILDPQTGQPIPETIYSSGSGSDVLTQPISIDSGVIDFYLDLPRRISVGYTQSGGSAERVIEDIDVGELVPVTSEFTTFTPGVLTVATGRRRSYSEHDCSVTAVRISVGTAPTGSDLVVDVNRNGTSIFSGDAQRPRIVAGSYTSVVLLSATLAPGDYLTCDVDQVGSTVPGSDLTVQISSSRYATDGTISDLNQIAGLVTDTFGRSLLTLTNRAGLTSLVDQATDGKPGVVQFATLAEAQQGSNSNKAVTPQVLASILSMFQSGEVQDGDLDAIAALATTPFGRGLLTLMDAPSLMAVLRTASTIDPGVLRLADAQTTLTGTDTASAVTPAGLKSLVVNYQQKTADLTSIAALVGTAGKVMRASGPSTWSLVDFSDWAVANLVNSGSSTTARSVLDVLSKTESAALMTANSEMGYAFVSSAVSVSGATRIGDPAGYVPGLSRSVVGDGRPVVVRASIPAACTSLIALAWM